MGRLSLYLFGPPRVERDGFPVTCDTRKAIALLAYLAVSHQPHTRDTLAALLWPEYDQAHARGTLRRTLSTLHKAVAGDWLAIGRETIGLARDARPWVDVDVFRSRLAEREQHPHPASAVCPACLEPLSEAVGLYTDDFLTGFALRDSPTFEDWQFFQAQSLRRELASALERLVACHSARGNFEAAITCARRWLALDRLHEPAHRQLMQLYAWAGQRAAALRQYRECVQVLAHELGVAPLEATTQLYEAINENQPPPPPARWAEQDSPAEVKPATVQDVAAPVAPHGPDRTPDRAARFPLVGRGTEWAALLAAYVASAVDGQLVVIEGEAGIGKTRLAEEFLAHVQDSGARVVAARCYEGEAHLAYGPVVTALRTAIGQTDAGPRLAQVPTHWYGEAVRILPELAALRPGMPAPPPLDTPGARTRFFEGLRQVLLALCAGPRPGVLFLDDLQWADGATLDLLAYIVRRLQGQPLCLLLTWRGDERSTAQRLRRELAEAQRANTATVVTPARLNAAMVGELTRSAGAVDAAESPALAERLYQETEGLPFFLVEYLAALATGALHVDRDEWSLPGGVREVLRSRLDAVDETGWQLLSTAAIIGRSFDFDTLREASGRSEEESVGGLEDLIAQGLVAEVQGGASRDTLLYDFSHEKLRALVDEETSLARRRLLHRRVAEVLVGRMRGQHEADALASQIAQHYLQAGNEAAAAEYFLLAGERARRLYAHAEALAHLRMALTLGHPEAARLHEAIGDLQTLLGEYSAALASYETAAALCTPDALAQVEHKLGDVYARRGSWELAESHLEAALGALDEAATGARARILADWSLTAYHRGHAGQALELAGRAQELAEAADDTRALAQVHNLLGILASGRGELGEARRQLEQSLALADGLDDPAARAAALNNLALAYGASGDLEQALALAEAALALCAAQGDRHREAALHNNLADLLHAVGRSEAAMEHLKQAVSIYAEIGVEAGTMQPEIWKLAEW